MPDLRLRQDFALWLKLLERGEVAHGLDRPLAVHHVHPNSLSAPKGRALRATWKMYREHLGLSPIRAGWYLSNHLLRRLLRGSQGGIRGPAPPPDPRYWHGTLEKRRNEIFMNQQKMPGSGAKGFDGPTGVVDHVQIKR